MDEGKRGKKKGGRGSSGLKRGDGRRLIDSTAAKAVAEKSHLQPERPKSGTANSIEYCVIMLGADKPKLV
jgi:hypothetical protein